jgi:hypothetical protein
MWLMAKIVVTRYFCQVHNRSAASMQYNDRWALISRSDSLVRP